MSDVFPLASHPLAAAWEKMLCFAGRFLHLIPADRALTIPFGINRGRRWIRGAANAPEWIGLYELRKQRVLQRLVAADSIVCDIGANAGFYSLALSRLVGAAGRVLSFEPLPRNVAKIERHLALNRSTNVSLESCALSDRNGTICFHEGENDFTGRISDDSEGFSVATRRLDDYLREHSLGDPALLKIDVEGAEARVLAGAAELLARSHPALVIAVHDAEQGRRCFEILCAAGYRLARLDGKAIERPEAMAAEIVALHLRGAHA